MARRNKTKEQQERYYEVDGFYGYLYDVKTNGNHTQFLSLYKELKKSDRQGFLNYLYDMADIDPTVMDWIMEIALENA